MTFCCDFVGNFPLNQEILFLPRKFKKIIPKVRKTARTVEKINLILRK